MKTINLLIAFVFIAVALLAGCASTTIMDSPEGSFHYDTKGLFEKGQWYLTDVMGNPPVPITQDQVDLIRKLPAHQRNAQIRRIIEDAYFYKSEYRSTTQKPDG
jgi:hypothetical protein